MATAAITEIAKELQCPICLEELDRPKVLDCKHVFCCKCLVKWVKQKKSLVCPVCKRKGHLRRGRKIQDLPEPLILTKLQETVTRFMTASLAVTGDRTCDFCTPTKAAGYFCHNCGKNRCEKCEKKHSSTKPFQNHKVIQLSKHTVCSEHKGELTTLCCQDCKLTLCNLCFYEKHEHHNVVDAQEVVPAKGQQLQTFKSSTEKIRKQIGQHESELKAEEKKLRIKYKSAERELENARRKFNDFLDEAERELEENLQAEIKKLLFHKRDVEDAKVAQENLLQYIDDILNKASDIEIVSAAADIPSMSTNVSLLIVLPTLQTPMVRGDDVLKLCKSLVHYGSLESGEKFSVLSSADTVIMEEPSPPDTEEPSPPKFSVAGPAMLQTRKTRAPVVETLPSFTLPQLPMAGEMGMKLWERETDCRSGDIVYHEKTGDLWVSTDSKAGGLLGYTLEGEVKSKLLTGKQNQIFHFSLDTKRDTFIAVLSKDVIGSISRSGEIIYQGSLPGGGDLRGVAYLPDRDRYAVCDKAKHCVWFVDAGRMDIVNQIGSQGSRDDQFNEPWYVCYHSGSGYPSPVIVVGDLANKCVKVLNTDGQFIRKYGSPGSGNRQLSLPAGICVDNKGRIVVCDAGNNRIVRFWHSRGTEQWEVVVTPEQLGGLNPCGVCVTNEGHLAVTGTTFLQYMVLLLKYQ